MGNRENRQQLMLNTYTMVKSIYLLKIDNMISMSELIEYSCGMQ